MKISARRQALKDSPSVCPCNIRRRRISRRQPASLDRTGSSPTSDLLCLPPKLIAPHTHPSFFLFQRLAPLFSLPAFITRSSPNCALSLDPLPPTLLSTLTSPFCTFPPSFRRQRSTLNHVPPHLTFSAKLNRILPNRLEPPRIIP